MEPQPDAGTLISYRFRRLLEKGDKMNLIFAAQASGGILVASEFGYACAGLRIGSKGGTTAPVNLYFVDPDGREAFLDPAESVAVELAGVFSASRLTGKGFSLSGIPDAEAFQMRRIQKIVEANGVQCDRLTIAISEMTKPGDHTLPSWYMAFQERRLRMRGGDRG